MNYWNYIVIIYVLKYKYAVSMMLGNSDFTSTGVIV